MTKGWFNYPKQTAFGRVLPKSKIYEHAKITNGLRKKLISQIDKIIWEYKLASETMNLPSQPTAPEIEIFSIKLKTSELDMDILRCIDESIPFPTFYQLLFENRIKVIAAYKRPSESNSLKWVVDTYFETHWQQIDIEPTALPTALDLAYLYEQMLRQLIPLPSRIGESLNAQVERLKAITKMQSECHKLEIRLQKEKQFNRKVALNSQLRMLKNELETLLS
jgi:hypothetical protein